MRLPFTDGLMRTNHFDPEMASLADRHYSRRTVGARQFCYAGRKLVLRDAAGDVLFVWMWPFEEMRMDGQKGYNCSIFRNESRRVSSEIVSEAERFAVEKWGWFRFFTYVNPRKLTTRKKRGAEYCPWPPGKCFYEAGWAFQGISKGGLHLLAKGALVHLR